MKLYPVENRPFIASKDHSLCNLNSDNELGNIYVEAKLDKSKFTAMITHTNMEKPTLIMSNIEFITRIVDDTIFPIPISDDEKVVIVPEYINCLYINNEIFKGCKYYQVITINEAKERIKTISEPSLDDGPDSLLDRAIVHVISVKSKARYTIIDENVLDYFLGASKEIELIKNEVGLDVYIFPHGKVTATEDQNKFNYNPVCSNLEKLLK